MRILVSLRVAHIKLYHMFLCAVYLCAGPVWGMHTWLHGKDDRSDTTLAALERFFVFNCCDAMSSFGNSRRPQEKDDWIGAIGRAIVQASSTYQGDTNNGDSDSEDDYNYR